MPEDRADVGVGDGLEHALVEALDRLERLGEQHPLLDVLERDRRRVLDRREGLAQARPEASALAVLVVLVEARAGGRPPRSNSSTMRSMTRVEGCVAESMPSASAAAAYWVRILRIRLRLSSSESCSTGAG